MLSMGRVPVSKRQGVMVCSARHPALTRIEERYGPDLAGCVRSERASRAGWA